VFNHTQWNGVNTTCNVDTSAGAACLEDSFLHPSGAHNPRILQLGLKFLF